MRCGVKTEEAVSMPPTKRVVQRERVVEMRAPSGEKKEEKRGKKTADRRVRHAPVLEKLHEYRNYLNL